MTHSAACLSPTQIAEELVKAVNGGRCIAWVGSGLSKPIFGDWGLAIGKLCKECGVADFCGSAAKPSAEQLIDKAEECKKTNHVAYERVLAGLYGRNVVKTRQAYFTLVQAPFKAYVTTNFDPLLSEAAYAANCRTLRYYPDLPPLDIERCEKPLFYIHGHARPNGVPSGRNLVLARSEFSQAYGDAGAVRLFVQCILRECSIVFMGCSLLEEDIRNQMALVHEMHIRVKAERDGFVLPLRYALSQTIFSEATGTRDEEAEDREVDRFRAIDTRVLRYDPVDRAEHCEIEETLKALCTLTSRVKESGPGEAGPV